MRCQDCWYDTDLCVCGRPNDDIELASAYILVASAPLGLHHPKDVDRAKEWVRRVAVRETRDPHGYDADPWGKPVVDAAWKAIGDDR